jgi:hypothetical protein
VRELLSNLNIIYLKIRKLGMPGSAQGIISLPKRRGGEVHQLTYIRGPGAIEVFILDDLDPSYL